MYRQQNVNTLAVVPDSDAMRTLKWKYWDLSHTGFKDGNIWTGLYNVHFHMGGHGLVVGEKFGLDWILMSNHQIDTFENSYPEFSGVVLQQNNVYKTAYVLYIKGKCE